MVILYELFLQFVFVCATVTCFVYVDIINVMLFENKMYTNISIIIISFNCIKFLFYYMIDFINILQLCFVKCNFLIYLFVFVIII